MKCPICKETLTDITTARWEAPGAPEDGTVRVDYKGQAWCKECTARHDKVDWDMVDRMTERDLEYNW